jgi:hypothetical protein
VRSTRVTSRTPPFCGKLAAEFPYRWNENPSIRGGRLHGRQLARRGLRGRSENRGQQPDHSQPFRDRNGGRSLDRREQTARDRAERAATLVAKVVASGQSFRSDPRGSTDSARTSYWRAIAISSARIVGSCVVPALSRRRVASFRYRSDAMGNVIMHGPIGFRERRARGHPFSP